ncbi:carbohydrate ABC transporter substrate-binding protein [Microbacterium sp. 4R-513]|uniref:ABC transporter substrate-binding protein n=1 Tax=Microbacterium sp. 4R-513 TaxID=2567934 RepID=UPI0013E146EB|nr:ABC transporter substrate-binding protein [Microbacterium sp. 4R-513]QIG39377.1 carbohydrate ABC transporter substrate-binding protein [Microbacterium sp. 4R-513]
MSKTRTSLKALAGLTLLSTAVLAGCSAGTEASNDDNEKVTLTWWSWDIADPKAVASQYEEAHPNVTIEVSQPQYNDYLTTLRPALTSGEGPDVFQVAPGTLLANYGPLADDLAPLAESAWGADWRDNYSEVAVSQLSDGDKVVALPNYMSGAGLMYYNASLVEELGIEIPTTVSEFVDACSTVTAAGYDCLAHGAKDAWVNTDVFQALAISADGDALQAAIAGEGEWTDPALVKAMTAWQRLFTDGVIPSGASALSEYPDANTNWLSNKAVFIALGTWNTPYTQIASGVESQQEAVTTPIDGVFLSAPFPAVDGNEPAGLFGGVANGWALNSASASKDAAFEFISWLSGKDGQQYLADNAIFPAYLGLSIDTSDVVDPRQLDDIANQQTLLSEITYPREIPYPDLATAIGQALSEVAAGTATPAAALETLQAASESIARG